MNAENAALEPGAQLSLEELYRLYPDGLPDKEAKQGIVQVGRRLYDRGYAAANDGNISYLAGPGMAWATPANISKGFLKEAMLVKVDVDGRVLEGTWPPSSELRMHLRVYRENPDARAVIHAHSPYATAFACAGMPLNEPILAEAAAMLGEIPVASFAQPGTPAVAESIAPYCRDHCGVLLANHGVLTWGASLTEALYRLERIEYYAHLLALTGHLPPSARRLAPELKSMRRDT